MSNTQKSIYQQYEDATRKYYGADKDPFKFVPVASNKSVAHELALQVERHVATINEADLAATALRAQHRNKMPTVRGETDLDVLKQHALEDRLRRGVVNTEISHAAMAPGDFNEDSEKAGAYEMGIGYVALNLPRPQDPPK